MLQLFNNSLKNEQKCFIGFKTRGNRQDMLPSMSIILLEKTAKHVRKLILLCVFMY